MNQSLNQIEKMEYELKTIWQRVQASAGESKQALLNEYRKKHQQLKAYMALTIGR